MTASVEFTAAMLRRELAVELRKNPSALMKEVHIQDAVAASLARIGCAVDREARISPRDRLDFLVNGSVAIEIKKANAGLNELAQVGRYLESPKIAACVIVAMRVNAFPPTFLGKPIHVIELWRMML